MTQRSGKDGGWCGALVTAACLVVGPAAAQAPGEEHEWAEEVARALDVGVAGDLRATLAFGCAAGRVGFRIEAQGGTPHAGGLLWIERQRMDGTFGKACMQTVRFDAYGQAELVVRDFELREELHARFAQRSGRGWLLSNEVVIPAHAPMELQSVQRGDVVITEIMKDPVFVSDSAGEWFELYNPTNKTRNIAGWRLLDQGSNKHTIDNGGNLLLIAPGQRLVLGIEADPALNGGVQVDYEYASFTLANGADSILLMARNGALVDQVDYDDGIFWPDTPGAALNVRPSAMDALLNDDPMNWCSAQTPIGAGNPDKGTPGAANDLCP
jgi:hypothetical protein